MANVLSQSEIDELLAALTAGEPEAAPAVEEAPVENIREYNFKTANKFPKEQIRTLDIVFENFSKLLATQLSGTLRAICEVEVVSVEELAFSEFNNSLPSPTILSIINMPPLQGSVLMEVTPSIAYAMVNRLFGGTDEDSSDTSKAFTEIELVVLERIIRQWMALIAESWAKVVSVEPVLERMETNSQYAQVVPLNETIAIIVLNVRIGKTSDFINICIPHVAIEPVANQMSTRAWFSSTLNRVVEPKADVIKDRLVDTQVQLHAVFDDTSATVSDILSLQVGDVIRLNHEVNKLITVKVAHLPKFKGIIGTLKAKYAVQVVEVMEEENADE